jgi:hypothetical protein
MGRAPLERGRSADSGGKRALLPTTAVLLVGLLVRDLVPPLTGAAAGLSATALMLGLWTWRNMDHAQGQVSTQLPWTRTGSAPNDQARPTGSRILDTVEKPHESEPEPEPNPPVRCPRCGSPMVVRMGNHGPFWGCSAFPNCRAVRPTDH